MAGIRIAVIPGDGVGHDVVPWAVQALKAASDADGGARLTFEELPWGCGYLEQTGAMMPADGLERLSQVDQILLGAIGWPTVADHTSLWGLLIPIRRRFKQYVNLRPARRLRGVRSPLRDATPFDFTVIRENTEGEYSDVGGYIHVGEPNEAALQTTVFTRTGTERIIKYAFDLASRSGDPVVGATKSNGMKHVMPYWDAVFKEVAAAYPSISASLMHADALAAKLVLAPAAFKVVVASNLLGDILSEVAAAVQGSIGMAASANLDPSGNGPSMFEPVHGSAPDIAGRGIANPIGALWSAKLLLDQIGKQELGSLLLDAIEDTVARDVVTPDLGGRAGTADVGQAIVSRFRMLSG